ncbi:MAG: hypothetical protein JW793_06010 [Acidobacteria bacterium]|nr:hypothetical protein [Acidobacteriota bacterium]
MDENPIEPIITDRMDVQTTEPESVLLTPDGRKFLDQTKPWARFLSIMVFIGAGFTFLGGLTVLIATMAGALFNAGSETSWPLPGGGFTIGFFYLIMALLYVPPGIFLSRYASAIKALESAGTSRGLENALKYQKSFWRYVGILTVAGLIVMAAVIAFSLAVGIFMFLNR